VVDEQPQVGAGRKLEPVLRAVAAEELIARDRVGDVDVGAHLHDVDRGDRHHADVDAARVVAVDQHAMPVPAGEQLGVEPVEGGAILRFDDGDDVGRDIVDDPGGHVDGGLVDGFRGQLEPADPRPASRRDDLDSGRFPIDVEAPAIGP
jgi:hypothetical protein